IAQQIFGEGVRTAGSGCRVHLILLPAPCTRGIPSIMPRPAFRASPRVIMEAEKRKRNAGSRALRRMFRRRRIRSGRDPSRLFRSLQERRCLRTEPLEEPAALPFGLFQIGTLDGTEAADQLRNG